MKKRPFVLFIDYDAGNEKCRRELAGVRRFASARGWSVATLDCAKSTPDTVTAVIARYSPIGCIVECAANTAGIPPQVFGATPVVYLDPRLPLAWRGVAEVLCDNAAVAKLAFRELSSGLPHSCAAVGYRKPLGWSRERVAAFAALCAKSRMPFEEFPNNEGEAPEERASRLAAWCAALPERCAVFAVNDATAIEVARAFRDTHRALPRSATLMGVDAATPPQEAAELPPLSSVRLDFEHAGYLAAKILGDPRYRAPGKNAPKRIRPTFGPLLVERRKSTGGQGRRAPFALEAVDIIRREACDGLTPDALIRRFSCSRNLFEMRFREATGHSVGEEIAKVRLERAMDLLQRTTIPISDIATMCGYRSSRALRKIFLSRLCVSMRRWRSERC
jgi:LacI family transcriptional regulator